MSKLLKWIEENTCDVRCIEDGLDSYYWEIVEHYQATPHERTIGVGSTVVDAIEDAMEKGGEGYPDEAELYRPIGERKRKVRQ